MPSINKGARNKEVKKPNFWRTFPIVFIAIVITLSMLQYFGYIDLRIRNWGIPKVSGDPFIGKWASTSPATYYMLDANGERYMEYKANFHLTILNDGKYYIGDSSREIISYRVVPGYSLGENYPVFIEPYSPLSFDARNYMNMPLPYSGISQVEIIGNTMTVNTPFGGYTQRIVLELVEGDKDMLYITLSSIGNSGKDPSGGDESSPNAIVLVRE
ncbi:MAG: hypothetical protein QW404_02625 [Candidatus Nanoarchaeia archaeon]